MLLSPLVSNEQSPDQSISQIGFKKNRSVLTLKDRDSDVSIKTMNSNFRKGLKEILWEHLQKNNFYAQKEGK